MSWLSAKLTRREFLQTLRRLAGLAVASAFSLPVGARFVKEARALGGRQALPDGRGDESPASPGSRDTTRAPQAQPKGVPLATAWMPASVQRWAPLIARAAERHGVDPNLVAALLLCKSAGSFCAVSPEGALGLMQVKPFNSGGVNLFDPPGNADVGVAYLAAQHEQFRDWETAVAAYDQGPGRVSQGTLSAQGRFFQESVIGIWQEAQNGPGPALQAWLTSGGTELVNRAEQIYSDPVLFKTVEFATRQWDKPYLWGGEGPDRWDCSALVQAAYRHAGIEIPRTATAQWHGPGRRLANDEARRPGDLVFFTQNGSSSDHVGIIIYPPDVFIEATGAAGRVKASSLSPDSQIYRADLAKRVLGLKRLV